MKSAYNEALSSGERWMLVVFALIELSTTDLLAIHIDLVWQISEVEGLAGCILGHVAGCVWVCVYVVKEQVIQAETKKRE